MVICKAESQASSTAKASTPDEAEPKFNTGDTINLTAGENLRSISLASESVTLLDLVNGSSTSKDDVWVQAHKIKLLVSDKESLLMPAFALTDRHINFAQVLFRQQYPSVSGFTSTLLQYKPLPTKTNNWDANYPLPWFSLGGSRQKGFQRICHSV